MKKDILITGAKGFIGKRIKGGKIFTGRLEIFGDLLVATSYTKGIVHLAAQSYNGSCEADILKTVMANIFGVYNVLYAALERKIWVLFISTYQVRRKNIYGLSKLMGEELCRVFQKKGVRVKILRLPIVYGPGDRSDKVVTKIIRELKAGQVPKIDTDEKFHFAYVDDIAKVIEKEVSVMCGNKYGRFVSLHDLVDGIKKCL